MSPSATTPRRQFGHVAATAGAATAGRAAAVRRATDCIVPKVSADPRYSADMRPDEINNLTVDSIPACGRLVREMIDTHDQMYGAGSGEAFLLGPYLDVLPAAVVTQVRTKEPAR